MRPGITNRAPAGAASISSLPDTAAGDKCRAMLSPFLRFFPITALLTAALPPAAAEEGDTIHIPPKIEWEKIAELPPKPGKDKNPGLAGVFAGAQEDVSIIAGGTNYPEGFPWTGASRAVYNEIYVLERTAQADGLPAFKWVEAQAQLPEAVSYGASVSLPDGVLCIGGATLTATQDACFLLSWDKSARKVNTTPFPKLPKALACHTAVLLKNTVYVIGGTGDIKKPLATSSFYALDLSKRGKEKGFEWKALTGWDGPSRIFPVAAASMEGEVESIYLCGGRNPGNEPDFLTDLHKFNPDKKEWSILGDVVDPHGHPGHVMATPAFHVPPHHFVIVGAMDEDITRLLERNARDIKELDDAEREGRRKYESAILQAFPGYSRTVLGYDAEIGEWNHIGNFPAPVPLTNQAVNWDSQIIIPGGETGPGRRTPEIWAATVRKKPVVIEEETEEKAPAPAPASSTNAESVDPPPADLLPAAPAPGKIEK
jgi:N-acetylneuraminic acid mutarotase